MSQFCCIFWVTHISLINNHFHCKDNVLVASKIMCLLLVLQSIKVGRWQHGMSKNWDFEIFTIARGYKRVKPHFLASLRSSCELVLNCFTECFSPINLYTRFQGGSPLNNAAPSTLKWELLWCLLLTPMGFLTFFIPKCPLSMELPMKQPQILLCCSDQRLGLVNY